MALERFKPILERVHPVDPTGIQRIYRFHNLRGASVIKNSGSYGNTYGEGLWELCPLIFTGEGPTDYELDDPDHNIRGYLDDIELEAVLAEISELPMEVSE